MPFYCMLVEGDFSSILTQWSYWQAFSATPGSFRFFALPSASVKIGPHAAGTSYRLPECCVPMCIPSLTPHYL